jgi:hypothetical protein
VSVRRARASDEDCQGKRAQELTVAESRVDAEPVALSGTAGGRANGQGEKAQ